MRKLGIVWGAALVAIALLSIPAIAEDAVLSTIGLISALEKTDICVCGTDPAGEPFCAVGSLCPGLTECSANSDCPAGYKCLTENCCDAPLQAGACVPVCDNGECVNPGVCGTYGDCEPPLFVSLSSFEAEYQDGAVVITWTTATEIDNVGFRIFRARARGQRGHWDNPTPQKSAAPVSLELELVTPRLIPAQGTVLFGASYQYLDAGPKDPGTLVYFLEDIDTMGKATLHGPLTIVFPGRTRVRVDGTSR